ncbi:MAG: LytTR family transcriptional regulator [Clostridia bacterium]|jgi:DNA-binding LytR/AlgR family response regulator|nr:LytTR family transcriptional regulator [Clostridia bacterium]
MNIKITTEFSDKIPKEECEIKIISQEMSKELSTIISNVENITRKKIPMIIAENDNKIYLLETEKIDKFYTSNQNVYCIYKDSSFLVRKKLYELEEILDNNIFIRISNSCIANIKQIECFDTRNNWKSYC